MGVAEVEGFEGVGWGANLFDMAVETYGKVKSPTRKTDVWATHVRSYVLGPGHPPETQVQTPNLGHPP
jgi:hypothetical protein